MKEVSKKTKIELFLIVGRFGGRLPLSTVGVELAFPHGKGES